MRLRTVVLLAAVAGVLATVVIGASDDPQETTVVGAQSTPEVAIREWLVDHRDELFPTYEGEYFGVCPDDGARDGLCSIPRDDLGPRRIHGLGVYGTNWGAEVLLERSSGRWTVIATWPWGEPGGVDADFGPPWSPHTAIAEWWAVHAAEWYPGKPVAYVQDCATTGADPSITEQTLVCSSLVSATDERRVYRSGRLPAGGAVVLVLDHRADHSWAVSAPGG